jgi:hypothetical protein
VLKIASDVVKVLRKAVTEKRPIDLVSFLVEILQSGGGGGDLGHTGVRE